MSRFNKFVKMIQIKMRKAYEEGWFFDPDTYRSCKRILYNEALHYGVKRSGFSSILKPISMSDTRWREENDIEDDHFNPPEFMSLFVFAHPERYLRDTKESLENMSRIFESVVCTHEVTGEQNQLLKKSSGLVDKGIITKVATSPTHLKYPNAGIECLYDKKGGKEISIEDACYIPQELTEWETKFWSGEFKFPMKGPLCPLSEYM